LGVAEGKRVFDRKGFQHLSNQKRNLAKHSDNTICTIELGIVFVFKPILYFYGVGDYLSPTNVAID